MQINVELPHELAERELSDLTQAEERRARELRHAGTIQRIWRIPGRRENVGVWSAPDADGVHSAIASLPMYRYLQVRVTALAEHPSEAPR